jgi:hypothetical protein
MEPIYLICNEKLSRVGLVSNKWLLLSIWLHETRAIYRAYVSKCKRL